MTTSGATSLHRFPAQVMRCVLDQKPSVENTVHPRCLITGVGALVFAGATTVMALQPAP